MKKILLLALALSFTCSVHAYEELPFDEYLTKKENQERFQAIKASGKLITVREQMVSICKKWNNEKQNIEEACACAAKEFNKFKDEELFYYSMVAYGRYQAKVQALENDNKELFEQLKEQFKNSPLPINSIEEKCN